MREPLVEDRSRSSHCSISSLRKKQGWDHNKIIEGFGLEGTLALGHYMFWAHIIVPNNGNKSVYLHEVFPACLWTPQLSFCQVNLPSQVFSSPNCKSLFDSSASSVDFLIFRLELKLEKNRTPDKWITEPWLALICKEVLRYWISPSSENNSPTG